MSAWACPKCAAKLHEGFVCECDSSGNQRDDHGETAKNPCHEAICDRCWWTGRMPEVKTARK